MKDHDNDDNEIDVDELDVDELDVEKLVNYRIQNSSNDGPQANEQEDLPRAPAASSSSSNDKRISFFGPNNKSSGGRQPQQLPLSQIIVSASSCEPSPPRPPPQRTVQVGAIPSSGQLHAHDNYHAATQQQQQRREPSMLLAEAVLVDGDAETGQQQQQQQQQHPQPELVHAQEVKDNKTLFMGGFLFLAAIAAGVAIGVLVSQNGSDGTSTSDQLSSEASSISPGLSTVPPTAAEPIVVASLNTTTSRPTNEPTTDGSPLTAMPTELLTATPTVAPTNVPIAEVPTSRPSVTPVQATRRPTFNPTLFPTSLTPTTEPPIAGTSPPPTTRPTASSPPPTTRPTANPTQPPATLKPTERPTLEPTRTRLSLEERLSGSSDGDNFGSYLEFSRDGQQLAVGADNYVRVFERTSSSAGWEQMGQTIRGDGGTFGHRLDLKSGVLVIGAPRMSENTGQVRVYEYRSGTWQRKGETLYGTTVEAYFGWDVALSDDGETIVCTARKADESRGYVEVYRYDDSRDEWEPLGPTLEGENSGDQFGRSVAMTGYGRRIAIGAVTGGDGRPGRIYVYDYIDSSSQWSQVGQTLDGDDTDDWQGTSVALSQDGRTLAIGSDGVDNNGSNSGAVKVYQMSAETRTWIRKGNIMYGERELDQFSAGQISLSNDGNVLAVGSNHYSGDQGKAYLYQFWNDDWALVGEKLGDADGNKFGFAVAVSGAGNRLAVGARGGNGYSNIYSSELINTRE